MLIHSCLDVVIMCMLTGTCMDTTIQSLDMFTIITTIHILRLVVRALGLGLGR